MFQLAFSMVYNGAIIENMFQSMIIGLSRIDRPEIFIASLDRRMILVYKDKL